MRHLLVGTVFAFGVDDGPAGEVGIKVEGRVVGDRLIGTVTVLARSGAPVPFDLDAEALGAVLGALRAALAAD